MIIVIVMPTHFVCRGYDRRDHKRQYEKEDEMLGRLFQRVKIESIDNTTDKKYLPFLQFAKIVK
jgi:hypothetical protein